jgi:hypothetical protein
MTDRYRKMGILETFQDALDLVHLPELGALQVAIDVCLLSVFKGCIAHIDFNHDPEE